jgi:hypothetical protein
VKIIGLRFQASDSETAAHVAHPTMMKTNFYHPLLAVARAHRGHGEKHSTKREYPGFFLCYFGVVAIAFPTGYSSNKDIRL